LADDARIRILPLGGTWETLGSERLRGIVPENIEASSDSWGPSAMTFQLKAEEGARRPDVLPFTPVELEVGGMLVWAGFVFQRPSDANSYSVSCRGWQFQLDDDLYERVYVHTRLSDYRDQRTYLGANLANFTVAGNVATDNGVIVLGWSKGTVIPAACYVGVTLDLGPDSTCKRIVVTWDSSNNDAGTSFFARGTAGESPVGSADDAFSFALNTGAAGTSAGTFAGDRRYIHLFLYNAGGGTVGNDNFLRIKTAQVFRATSYEAFNASILKASTVIKDALTFAPLLNQSVASVAATSFVLPSYLTGGYVTPRAAMEAANLVESDRLKIGGGDLKTLVYDDKPTAPIAEVGEWSGSQFDDATVTGEPIFNRAIIDGTGPDGARLVSKRTQTGDLVTRRGFTRSSRVDVSTAGTSAVFDRINDLWLAEHKTAPFSGTLRITGNGARRVLSSQAIPPQTFLLYAGEKIRMANRVDPDTGAWGRDGRIAGATYRHNERTVEIAIDDQRTMLAEVLARYAALVGG
jgi:hypothetical protein